MTSVYVVLTIVGGLAAAALFKGWWKTGVILVIVFGIMAATTPAGPHVQNGAQAGVDGLINTIQALFH